MRIQVAVPEQHIEQPVLESALEAVTRLNESLLANGEIPTFQQAANRVRWKPEPPGQEHFDNGREVLSRGHGDCDDLAPWHTASLRATGEDPGAITRAVQTGPKRWHAVTERSDGSIEDPSLTAGMPGRGIGTAPAAIGMMNGCDAEVGTYLMRPQIALRPVYGEWQARADLPWQWAEHTLLEEPQPSDYAMTALHTAPTASTALVGAIMGAVQLADAAEAGDPDHLARLYALANAAQGVPYEDIEAEFGPEHASAAAHVMGAFYQGTRRMQRMLGHSVGFGWGDLADIAVNYALPIAASAVPGASLATPFIQAGYRAVKAGAQRPSGGGQPAPAGYAPQAPAYAVPTAAAPTIYAAQPAPMYAQPAPMYAAQPYPAAAAPPRQVCFSM